MLNGRYIFVTGDLGYYFIPPRYLWVNNIKSFELPFWNPHNYSGIPLMATLQPGVFYPPHILYLFFPFNIVWNWLIILHFALAGISMFYLMRQLKTSKEGAFVSGIIFMLSGYLFANHSQIPYLFAIAWSPLIVLYCFKYIISIRPKHLVITSCLLTIQFFAGAPEITFLTFFLLSSFIFFPHILGEPTISIPLRIKAFLLCLILFFLLSSVQLLPFYELKMLSIRGSGLSYQEATAWSFGWSDLLQFFLAGPSVYYLNEKSYWLKQSYLSTLYLGIIPFFLSTLYFASNSKKRIIFFVLILISLVLALGKFTPIYKLFYNIPILNSIRYPVKFLFLFFFVIAISAGFGFDRLKGLFKDNNNIQNITIYLFLLFSLISSMLFFFIIVSPENAYRLIDSFKSYLPNIEDSSLNFFYIKRFLIFSSLFGFVLLLYLYSKGKVIFLWIIAILLITDLFFINFNGYRKVSWSFYSDKSRVKEYEFLKSDNPPGRYFMTPQTFKAFFITYIENRIAFPFHYASIFGLYTVAGHEVLELKNYRIFRGLLESPQSAKHANKLLDIAGVRYIISSESLDEKSLKELDLSFLKNGEIGNKKIYFYEYRSFPGKFQVFHKVHYLSNEDEIIKNLYYQNHDLRKELFVLSKENKTETYKEGDINIKTLSYRPNTFAIQSRTDNDAFLYITDSFYPGWNAYIDGKKTDIYRANLTFRAIKLPKGNHTIVFDYRPISFYIGAALTVLGCVISIFLFLKHTRRGKGYRGENSYFYL
jgi:hypothetical protein